MIISVRTHWWRLDYCCWSFCRHWQFTYLQKNTTNDYQPNFITLSRIAGSLGLLFCDVAGMAFWVLYVLCGITDIADGWVARKF
ncbi:MAG: CDP-alcohol phosphatidyltransferase family protein, partial [Bacteroidales bacterium]|nr:CDP-alcohol phosphatidyltransferase family protein [Bacteroidales bacterium]